MIRFSITPTMFALYVPNETARQIEDHLGSERFNIRPHDGDAAFLLTKSLGSPSPQFCKSTDNQKVVRFHRKDLLDWHEAIVSPDIRLPRVAQLVFADGKVIIYPTKEVARYGEPKRWSRKTAKVPELFADYASEEKPVAIVDYNKTRLIACLAELKEIKRNFQGGDLEYFIRPDGYPGAKVLAITDY